MGAEELLTAGQQASHVQNHSEQHQHAKIFLERRHALQIMFMAHALLWTRGQQTALERNAEVTGAEGHVRLQQHHAV